jgi:hypothetical protein
VKAQTLTLAAAAAALAGAVLLVMAPLADARPQRPSATVAAFKRSNPCPATGQIVGACPGHVVGPIVPTCAEGEDALANMQWRTVVDARDHEGWAREYCRFHRVRARAEGGLP